MATASLETVSEAMDRFATAVTNKMRVTGLGPNGESGEVVALRGDILRETVCIRVRWGWLFSVPVLWVGLCTVWFPFVLKAVAREKSKGGQIL